MSDLGSLERGASSRGHSARQGSDLSKVPTSAIIRHKQQSPTAAGNAQNYGLPNFFMKHNDASIRSNEKPTFNESGYSWRSNLTGQKIGKSEVNLRALEQKLSGVGNISNIAPAEDATYVEDGRRDVVSELEASYGAG